MGALDDAPLVEMEDRAGLRAWLQANHASSRGIWLVTWRSGSGHPHLAYDDVVEELLCFGWIDGQVGRVDADRRKLYVAPRRPAGVWARTNKARVARLTADGLMTPAGQAAIDRAKANGSWAALEAAESLEVPADLAAAFDARPGARASWDAFSASVRTMGLAWLGQARRPETRAARVLDIAEAAARGEKPAPARPRPETPRPPG